MCMGCYQDSGLPNAVTPELIAISNRLKEADEFGGLHIVVSDWNLEDDHISFCRDYETTTSAERALAEELLKLTLEQRAVAMALADGYLLPNGQLSEWALGALDET